jgi:ABC-2 type transport system permease protein
MNLLTWAISGTLFWYSIYFLENLVTTGGLDRFLLRPIGLIKQLVCNGFGYTFLGQIVVCCIFMGKAFWQMSYNLSIYSIIYIVFAIIGGILLQAGMLIIIGSLSFWILRSTQVGQVVCYDLRELINYPMNIYPKFIKIILTFVFPWGFVNYYPSIIILNKSNSNSELILGFIAPIIGISIFILSLKIFNLGLKRYNGAGN